MTDTTFASPRTFYLQIAIRLQPKLLKAWGDFQVGGGLLLRTIYRYRFLDLLNHGIIVYRRALELCLKDGSQCTCMVGLASALWYRFGRTGSIVDLNEAMLMDRETLSWSLRPTPHPDRSLSLTNLGIRLYNRFRRAGSMADLKDAILMRRESLSPHPTWHASSKPFSFAQQSWHWNILQRQALWLTLKKLF